MSKPRTKSRKKPRHPRTALPSALTRARIADAVHQAVQQVTGDDGRGWCHIYAIVGAGVATALTGHTYVPQAGELMVSTGDINSDGTLYYTCSPALSGYNGLEYHAWMALLDATDEVADLSMRHYEQTVIDHGMPWRRGPLPDYYWGTWSGLKRLNVRLNVDRRMTDLIVERGLKPAQEAAQIALTTLRAA